MTNDYFDRYNHLRELVPARIEQLLKMMWAHDKHNQIGEGYPTSSAGFSGSGVSGFDDWEADADTDARQAMGTVWWEVLGPGERLAIEVIYGKVPQVYANGRIEQVVVEAVRLMGSGLAERGMI